MLRTLIPNYAPRAVVGGTRHLLRSSNVFVTELFCGMTPVAALVLGDQQRSLPVGCARCRVKAAEIGYE